MILDMATVQCASGKPVVAVYHGSSSNYNSQPSIALDKVRQRETDLSHLESRWTPYCLYHIPAGLFSFLCGSIYCPAKYQCHCVIAARKRGLNCEGVWTEVCVS